MKCISIIFLAVATACSSSSQRPLVQRPTVAETQLAVSSLKAGMTVDEAITALAFSNCPRFLWESINWGFDLNMDLDLGPVSPPAHSLDLHFGFTNDVAKGGPLLESWSIRTNEWKTIDTEQTVGSAGRPAPQP